jgi:hypothetical protein
MAAAAQGGRRRQQRPPTRWKDRTAVKIHQLSLFLDNKPGHLSSVCQTLADAGVNILTLALADTRDYGILRLIVEDWEKAKSVLEQTGRVVKVTEVVATEVDDQPGGLARLLKGLEKYHLNVEYMYAFTFGSRGRAVMVFRFDLPDAAIGVLRAQGAELLDTVELYKRAKQ